MLQFDRDGSQLLSIKEWERNDGRPSELARAQPGLMSGCLRCGFLDTVFTRGSHNWGVSVVLITQHLFTRELRIARNNCHYMVLMRNPAGALQIRNLGAQLFPGGALRYFLEAYEDATAEPFGYLLVDMHPTTGQQLRLKTHIYPGEMCVVYMPRARANFNANA